MPNPILDAAKNRITAIAAERAALDREERELRAMVAAAEDANAAPSLPAVPWTPLPVIVPGVWPPFTPAPAPLTPWIVEADHGGLCACPQCIPRVTCGPSGIAVIPDGGAHLIIENGHLCAGNYVPQYPLS